MKRQAVCFIAICLAVAIGYFAWHLRHRHPIDMQKLYGGTANLQAVQSPEKVQIWKTEGFLNRQSGSPPEESAFYRKGGEAKTVSSDVAKSLTEQLANPSSYYDDSSAKSCIPMPGFVIAFTRPEGEVDIFVCFECDILVVHVGENSKAEADFDPSHNELLRIIKTLYPNDDKVQALRERKRR